MRFSNQISANWQGYIISISGHCASLISKNWQTFAGINKNDRVSFMTFLDLIFGGILLFGQIVHRPRNTGGYRLPWVYMIKLYCNAVSVTAFPTNVQPQYQITVDSKFKGLSWHQSFILKSEILYFINVINIFFRSFHIIYLKSNYSFLPSDAK